MSNTGRNLKEIDKLLRIASGLEETEFQRNSHYKKFKAKKIVNRNEFDRIIRGLDDLKFRHECIYWNEKILKENVCTKDEHYEVLNNLCHAYFDIHEYDIAIEYGKKALAIIKVAKSTKSYKVVTNN